jgi:hypothetical protein
MKDTLIFLYERKEKSRDRYGKPEKILAANSFICAHCRGFVSSEPGLSGVQNRNHCPYCLYSRHLDLHEAGDRLSACKAPMRPVGLTIKAACKKYGPNRGELMLIHVCEECKALSINRIAADDDPHRLMNVFEGSLCLDARLFARLESERIKILKALDRESVYAQLFGQRIELAEMLFPACGMTPSFAQED